MLLIRSFLDLSTAHLQPGDRQLLDHSADPACRDGLAVMTGTYGWLVHAAEDRNCEELSDALWAIFEKARSLGCDYVMLDADAPIDPDLPVFEATHDEPFHGLQEMRAEHAGKEAADGGDEDAG